MTTIPPASSLLTAQLSLATSNLRDRISLASEEAVTGRYADLTTQVDGRIGEAMLSQKALDAISLERDQLNLQETRLDILQSSLTAVSDAADGLAVRMHDALGFDDPATRSLVARDAETALERAFSALNVRHGERFLFSGQATATQPVGEVSDLLDDVRQIAATATDAADFTAQLDTYFNDPAGGWQQNIFAGSATPTDPDGVTAADPAITELISGLAVMAISGQDETLPLFNTAPDLFRDAAVKVSSGQAAIIDVQSERGVSQQAIARAQEALNSEETVLTEAFNEMTARDQYEAALELQELERNLEASYLLTARLSNLTLLNFLR